MDKLENIYPQLMHIFSKVIFAWEMCNNLPITLRLVLQIFLIHNLLKLDYFAYLLIVKAIKIKQLTWSSEL